MKRFVSKQQKIGEFAEDICVKYLEKNSFSIKERNYTKRIGEIDIIAEKDSKLYFIEVKSIKIKNNPVSYETYNPAENITRSKLKKILSIVQVYLKEKNVSYETSFQIDAYIVYIKEKQIYIKKIENIIAE